MLDLNRHFNFLSNFERNKAHPCGRRAGRHAADPRREAAELTYRVVFTARASTDAVVQFHYLADRSPDAAAR